MVAVLLKEPGYEKITRELSGIDVLYSSTLMEAELRSVASREKLGEAELNRALSSISWISPERKLTSELRKVLKAGHLRGSDLWHLACALYLWGEPSSLPFLTLDLQQAKVAASLGFPVVRI